MTLAEVAAAKQALEAEGLHPSYDAIVARVGGSKRDVAALMRALSAAETAREAPTLVEPAPLSPLVQAKMTYTQALQAVAEEQAVQLTTRAAQQQHLTRLTYRRQVLAPAEAVWRAVELEARTALAQLQHARAAQGRGSRQQQAHTQAQAETATLSLQALLATEATEEALVQAGLDALQEPLVNGQPLVSGLVGG